MPTSAGTFPLRYVSFNRSLNEALPRLSSVYA